MPVKNKLLYFIPIVLVYFLGMFVDILELDEAQYAEISRQMLQNGEYLQVKLHGKDYLDKPPLLYWLSTLSFRFFGISSFAYRLPSVLFTLLGLFATYRLGQLLYNERVGFYASLILSTCLAWFLFNHDVRTDTILAGCTAFSLWQLCVFLNNQKFIHIFWGGLGIAGAMMTKGPIGLMVPGLAIGFHLIVRREWKKIFQWQWLAMIGITMICLLPMMIGLYKQYDMQPGKLIDGIPIHSGLKFYFWTQSFGRITGENNWKNDSTILYFTHTFLWVFLPWSLLYLASFVRATRKLIGLKFYLPSNEEAITWGGFVFPFIAFSLSQYKLPHYIYVILPLAAISTANYVYLLIDAPEGKEKTVFKYIQLFIVFVFLILSFLLNGFCFPVTSLWVWAVWGLGLFFTSYFAFGPKSDFQRLLLPSLIGATTLNFILNINFFPKISVYASANKAAQFVATTPEADNFALFGSIVSNGIHFFSNRIITQYADFEGIRKDWMGKTVWIFTDQEGFEEIKKSREAILETIIYDHYHVSMLTLNFLNPSTRPQQISKRFLVKLNL